MGNTKTLEDSRTQGRKHVYFKYVIDLPAKKCHQLGIEILSDGSNCAIPPSIHYSGDVYKFNDNEIVEMPEDMKIRLHNLIAMFEQIQRCNLRKCLLDYKDDWSKFPWQGGEGHLRMLMLYSEMKANTLFLDHAKILSKLIFREEYNNSITEREWNAAGADKPWRKEKVKEHNLFDCEKCKGCKYTDRFDKIFEFPLTDVGNSERFLSKVKNDVLYNFTASKWMFWNGKIWEEDNSGKIVGSAILSIREINNLLADLGIDEDDFRFKFFKTSESKGKINAMIDLSQHNVPVHTVDFDKNKLHFNVQNGILDLNTSTLIPHNRDNYMTKISPVSYNPEAQCPEFLKFLDMIFLNDKEIIHYIHKCFGYCLSGYTGEKVLFVFYGEGWNGKTTLLNIIAYIMGNYAMCVSSKTIMEKKNSDSGNAANSDIARLYGARFVYGVESKRGDELSEGLIKQLTGGDPVPARFMFQEIFEYVPEYKIFIGTNHKPVIKGQDEAIWNRLKIIPFLHRFEKPIPDYWNFYIEKESEGILNWMVEGWKLYQKEGLKPPQIINDNIESYREEMDVLKDFLVDTCENEKESKVHSKHLHKLYQLYSAPNKVVGIRMFPSLLEERGYKKMKDAEGVYFKGIRMKPAFMDILSYPIDDREKITQIQHYIYNSIKEKRLKELEEMVKGGKVTSTCFTAYMNKFSLSEKQAKEDYNEVFTPKKEEQQVVEQKPIILEEPPKQNIEESDDNDESTWDR